MSVINPQRGPWYSRLQHAGVVFLRDFVLLASTLTISISSHYGKDIAVSAIASALASLADLIAHR